MKTSTRISAGALLLAAVNAQTSTITNNTADGSTTTVFYSVCPTATTTTTTLSSTLTYSNCPNGNCGGVGTGPVITPPPDSGNPYSQDILDFTTTLPNGDVEVIHEEITIFPHQICSSGSSICQATYTVTATCPCEDHTSIPAGFEVQTTSCDVCHQGGPTIVTQTVPCTTSGVYATVTPSSSMGPTGAAPNAQAAASAAASASASAYAAAGGNGASSGASGSGSGSAASNGGAPGSGSSAQAGAGAGANAAAAAPGGSAANAASNGSGSSSADTGAGGGNAQAAAGANAAAQAGSNVSPAGAASAPNSGAKYDMGNATTNTTANGIAHGQGRVGDTPTAPIASAYTGNSAGHATFAITTVLGVAIGCLAFML